MQDTKERLRYIRKLDGLTQDQIYNEGRKGRAKVERVEQGETNPSVDYILFWVERGYNANWILTGTGPVRRIVSEDDPYAGDINEIISILEDLKGTKAKKAALLEQIGLLQRKLFSYGEQVIKLQSKVTEMESILKELTD